MEIKKYAPVIMTTLCRYEHFKRCLESLERCTGAEYTDVYVALDYPASEKHVEGWKKIDAFLKEKEQQNGFKSLNVRRRDHNCGVGKPGSNGDLLYQEIRKITDRFISFEDDNEFSPCFLDYVNKGLEKYDEDDRIISVCAYTPFDYDGGENVYFARQESAWGHGLWIRKKEEIDKFHKLEEIKKTLTNPKTAMKMYRFRPTLLNRMLNQVVVGEVHGDVCNVAYCVLYNRYSMFPSHSLVRNWGNDGTGVHCKTVNEKISKRKICTDLKYDIDDVEVYERKVIFDEFAKVATKGKLGNLAILFRYFIWRLTKKDVFSLVRK